MTDETRLDVDDDIDELLRERMADHAPDPNGVVHNDSEEMLADLMQTPTRTLFGMARAVQRMRAQLDTLAAERGMINEEYDRRANAIGAQMRFLDSTIGVYVTERREATHGRETYLDIPGVGRWSTTAHASSFTLTDAAKAIAWIRGEGRETLRVMIKEEPELRWGDFKSALPALVAEHGELPPGIERTAATVSYTSPLVKK